MTEATTDHHVIREWAETRGARPAERLPARVDGEQAVLSFIFPGQRDADDRVRETSWEHFFDQFDLLGLSFVGGEGWGLEQKEFRILYDPANLSILPAPM